MWQRFTERARRVILLGQEEAGKMNSGHVGTEHLLLGIVRQDDGVATQILKRTGISLPAVRQEIEAEIGANAEFSSSEPKLTPKAKRVLELAADEARRMRHDYIGSEHLLIALLREKDSLAALVLRRLGLDLEKARELTLEYLGPAQSEDEPSQSTDGKPASQDDPTPEAQILRDLTTFVTNLNGGAAFPANLALVYGARIGYFGANVWARSWEQGRLQHQIVLHDIDIDLNEAEAQVKVTYHVGALNKEILSVHSKESTVWKEEMTLRLGPEQEEQKHWQIVPPEQYPLRIGGGQSTLLTQAAFALAQKEPASESKNAAHLSQIRLKQLCLGILQFTADWNDSFAFDSPYLQEALLPYLTNQEIFLSPQSLEPYAFNDFLSGKSLDDVPAPSQTIMFYEGEEQNLIFRYEGKAVIATVDGRCLVVTPEQAQQFIWIP